MYTLDPRLGSITNFSMHAYMLMIKYDHTLLLSLILESMWLHDIYMIFLCQSFHIADEMSAQSLERFG